MKLRHLFMVNILIAIFFGGSCTFFPHFVYSLYNVVPDEAAIWVARLTGGSILGFATLILYLSVRIKIRKLSAKRQPTRAITSIGEVELQPMKTAGEDKISLFKSIHLLHL